jgi:hypothetical protein
MLLALFNYTLSVQDQVDCIVKLVKGVVNLLIERFG